MHLPYEQRQSISMLTNEQGKGHGYDDPKSEINHKI